MSACSLVLLSACVCLFVCVLACLLIWKLCAEVGVDCGALLAGSLTLLACLLALQNNSHCLPFPLPLQRLSLLNPVRFRYEGARVVETGV